MADFIVAFDADEGDLIVAFDERGFEKFLVLAIIDREDNIKNEVSLSFEAAEELFTVLLDFLTEG